MDLPGISRRSASLPGNCRGVTVREAFERWSLLVWGIFSPDPAAIGALKMAVLSGAFSFFFFWGDDKNPFCCSGVLKWLPWVFTRGQKGFLTHGWKSGRPLLCQARFRCHHWAKNSRATGAEADVR